MPISEASYPEFGYSFPEAHMCVQEAEAELAKVIDNAQGESTGAIKAAFENMMVAAKNFYTLADKMKGNYNIIGRALTSARLKNAKTKEKLQHARDKALEYKEKVKILEQKVTDAGGTVDDVSRLYAQVRKRKRDAVEEEKAEAERKDKSRKITVSKENKAVVQPRKKELASKMIRQLSQAQGAEAKKIVDQKTIIARGDKPLSGPRLPEGETARLYGRREIKSRKDSPDPEKKAACPEKQTSSFRDTTPLSSTSNPSSSSYNTPIPRAKLSDFTREVPPLMKDRFVTNRSLRPTPLVDPTGQSSQVTAVLQGLCASVKAHEAWKESQGTNGKPAKGFVNFMADMQQEDSRPMNAYAPQCLFELTKKPTSKEDDPTKYLKTLLDKVNTLYVDNAFGIRSDYGVTCSCSNDTQFKQGINKSWTLPLKPTFNEAEMRSHQPPSRTVETLLREKTRSPEPIPCPVNYGTPWIEDQDTFKYQSHTAKKHFLGFTYAPENIIFSFDRSGAHDWYKVQLPLEKDFGEFVRASAQKTKYRLVTVVKKMKSGMFAAFVHTEDGKWWRVIDNMVREVRIEDWQGERNGETILAFYEQLDE